MDKYKLYDLYKNEVRSKSYDVSHARFNLDQAIMRLRMNIDGKYELMEKLEFEMNNYIKIFALDVIEYVMKKCEQEKNNP